jgi:hypothetical protein
MLHFPKVNERRLHDEDDPLGYLESFMDYVGNNRYAVEWFLDNANQLRKIVEKDNVQRQRDR